MNRGKQIQEQYLNLRYKVEGKIKQLQSKLSPQQVSNSRLLTPTRNNSSSQMQHHCHHNCHHPHNCHSTYHHTAQFSSQNNLQPGSSEFQLAGNRGQNSKNTSVNELISEALVESLKNQRQINDHIKAINQKIETISVHNRSNISEVFTQSVSKDRMRVMHTKRNKKRYEQEKKRCQSQVKTEQRPSRKPQSKIVADVSIKKIKNKMKQTENIHSINTQRSKKNNKNKSKSISKMKSEYFLSFGCPIHSPNKIMVKSPASKQIYKDSHHRNRKHQKNHLIESFRQQQKSRKHLISKVAQNAFNQYGRI